MDTKTIPIMCFILAVCFFGFGEYMLSKQGRDYEQLEVTWKSLYALCMTYPNNATTSQSQSIAKIITKYAKTIDSITGAEVASQYIQNSPLILTGKSSAINYMCKIYKHVGSALNITQPECSALEEWK